MLQSNQHEQLISPLPTKKQNAIIMIPSRQKLPSLALPHTHPCLGRRCFSFFVQKAPTISSEHIANVISSGETSLIADRAHFSPRALSKPLLSGHVVPAAAGGQGNRRAHTCAQGLAQGCIRLQRAAVSWHLTDRFQELSQALGLFSSIGLKCAFSFPRSRKLSLGMAICCLLHTYPIHNPQLQN